MLAARPLRLTAIGTLAGLFSGLFGVGGGSVIVPLLILWLGYAEREATGTSLAAIVLVAFAGALTQGVYGNVHPAEALLVGVPAMFGVVLGTSVQQRASERSVSLMFAALLVVIALELALR